MAAVLVLSVLAAYSPALRGGFIWDDDYYVTENRTLTEPGGLGRIWFELGAVPQYYPLVHTSYWIEHRLWGLEPFGYHLTNVLLHAFAAILLWLVLRSLSVPWAFLGAALFAVHPVHVESVAWITERKNVLSGFFYLAAAWAYLRHRGFPEREEAGSAASPRLYAASLALFLCAMLSKTVACSLPAALCVVLWWKRGRIRGRELLELSPLFAIGAGLGLLTAWMESAMVGARGAGWDLSMVDRCLIAGRALWFYAGKLVLPARLTFIYPRWTIDASAWTQFLYPAAALALGAALWLGRARIGRGPLAAALFFGGTLVPALGFFDVYPMRFSFVADHFQYLASIGLLTLAAAAFARGGETTLPWRRGAAAAAIIILGLLAWRQARVYRDIETLWLDTIAKNPSCWMAQDNLANLRVKQGRLEEARRLYSGAIELKPDYVEARNNLGVVLFRLGRLEESAAQFHEVLALRPDYPKTRNNLGAVLLRLGRPGEAVEEFEHALRLNPAMEDARRNLEAAREARRVPED